VCTVAGSTLTLVGQGECHVTASQAGDENFAAAPDVDRWFNVQLPQTLDFPAVPDQLFSNGSVQLGATATSGYWIQYTTSTPSVCSPQVLTGATYGDRETAQSPISSDTVTFNSVGTCTITAVQPSDSGLWQKSPEITRSFKIYEKADAPVLTLKTSTGVALSKRTAAFSASSTAAAPAVKVTSATPAVCAVSGSAVTLKKAGTCTIAATQAGAVTVKRSFPVWGAPAIPAKGKTTQTVTVLGQGEGDLSVAAGPAKVCRTSGSDVLLLGTGTCKVTVADGGRTVRKGSIKVAYVKSAKPSSQLKHGGTAYFAFDSAKLTAKAKKALSGHLDTLRDASTVVVYGNTYGPGKNSEHSRELAAQRAAAVVKYLRKHGVKAKAVTVAAAMENPVSKNPAKNRRADVYYTD
jgi:outer membrane protein OmpA-like peptidoglycan-associated protein